MISARKLAWAALALALTGGSLQAQHVPGFHRGYPDTGLSPFRRWQPDCAPGVIVNPPATMPPTTTPPTTTPPTTTPPTTPMPNGGDPFTPAPDALSNTAENAYFTPTMFGDSPPTLKYSNVYPFATAAYINKIADNASPRPLDRFYVGYNYFDNLGSFTAGGSNVNGHIETIGFEKTFLDGNASVGMRLPFLQFTSEGFSESFVGDLSLSFKYAFVNEADTVLSGGLAMTFPTGRGVEVGDGSKAIHPVFFQPFGAAYLASGDLFVHGFSSLMIPTDRRSPTVWFNDVAVGYWLYKDPTNSGILTGVVPTFEVHVSTPLNNRYPIVAGSSPYIPFADDVNLTMGSTFFMGQSCSVGVAYSVPVTGPRPFNGEAIVQFNLRY